MGTLVVNVLVCQTLMSLRCSQSGLVTVDDGLRPELGHATCSWSAEDAEDAEVGHRSTMEWHCQCQAAIVCLVCVLVTVCADEVDSTVDQTGARAAAPQLLVCKALNLWWQLSYALV